MPIEWATSDLAYHDTTLDCGKIDIEFVYYTNIDGKINDRRDENGPGQNVLEFKALSYPGDFDLTDEIHEFDIVVSDAWGNLELSEFHEIEIIDPC